MWEISEVKESGLKMEYQNMSATAYLCTSIFRFFSSFFMLFFGRVESVARSCFYIYSSLKMNYENTSGTCYDSFIY